MNERRNTGKTIRKGVRYEVKRQWKSGGETQGERRRDEMLQGYQRLTVPPYRTLGWTSKNELLFVSRP